jgi:hypothetical protein
MIPDYFFYFANLAGVFTTLHFYLIKYKNPLNVKNSLIQLLASTCIGVSIILFINFFLYIKNFLSENNGFDFWDFLLSLIYILFLYFVYQVCTSISERKRVSEKKYLNQILITIVCCILIYSAKYILSSNLEIASYIFSIDQIKLLFPLLILYLFLLNPKIKHHNILKVVVVFIIFINIIDILNSFKILEIESTIVWNYLGKISIIIQFFSFFIFSGSIINRFFNNKKLLREMNLTLDIVNAVNEILNWGDTSENYWNTSNLCFQNGFYDYGIETLKKGVQKQKRTYYDEAMFYYQLACGYALKNEKQKSLSMIKKAFYLYPKFEVFAKKDEMLENILSELNIKKYNM